MCKCVCVLIWCVYKQAEVKESLSGQTVQQSKAVMEHLTCLFIWNSQGGEKKNLHEQSSDCCLCAYLNQIKMKVW